MKAHVAAAAVLVLNVWTWVPAAAGTETSSATAPVVATVLGEPVRTSDPGELQDAILSALFDQYARQQQIVVVPAEVDAFVDAMRRGMAEQGLTAESDLTPEEAAEVEAMRREMGASMIRHWKINKALYEQYGGRIIYQQLGPEPLDAYRRFLEERSQSGAFAILDPALAQHFWRYFTDETIHDFMESGSADEARAFSSPPYLPRDQPDGR